MLSMRQLPPPSPPRIQVVRQRELAPRPT
eukprot:COSAG01_NODE_3792_length_5691_cov_11.941166_9_plen_28_part_01